MLTTFRWSLLVQRVRRGSFGSLMSCSGVRLGLLGPVVKPQMGMGKLVNGASFPQRRGFDVIRGKRQYLIYRQ